MLAILAAAALASTEPRVAQFTAGQMLAVADVLQRKGESLKALAIYEGLGADPSPQVRAEALARRALILDRSGRTREAAALMRQLVDARPDSGPERIALARMLDRIGDLDAARRQLRAAQASHLPPALARMTARYANALRARAPYGWSVEVSLAPDSNINRATASDTLQTVIGDFRIDKAGRPHSGLGLGLRGSAFARAPLSESTSWAARVDLSQDRYRERGFDRSTLALSTGPEIALGRTRLNLEAGVGRSAFGHQTYQRWAQLSARATRPLGTRTAIDAGLSLARVDNLANDLQDGRSLQASLGVERAITANLGAQVQLTANRFAARDPGYSTRSLDAAVGGWFDLGRVTLSGSAARGVLVADERLSLFPEKRTDSSRRFSLGASSRSIQLMTFSPFVRVNWERNESSVEIWDYQRRRIEFGLQRAY